MGHQIAPETCVKYASGLLNPRSFSRSRGCESFWLRIDAVPSSTDRLESPIGPSLGARSGVTMILRSPNSSGTPACV